MNPHGQSGRRVNHVGTLADRLAAGRGSRAGGAVRGGICPGDSARRGGPPSCGSVPQPAGSGLDRPGDARGAVDDLHGAIEDLDLAERIGAPPDSLAAARLSLADRVAEEVRADLDAGEPARALERIEELARHKISGPALRRSREIAEAWQAALAEGRRGEFGRAQEQLDRAERLAGGAGAIAAQQAVAAAKVELENRQKGAAPKVEALYAALSEGKWPAILSAAEAVLAIVPEHPAARQARSRAWQQIAAIGPAAAPVAARGGRAAPQQANPMTEPGTGRPEHNESASRLMPSPRGSSG